MSVANQSLPITRAGYERLEAELEDLTVNGRREMAAWLRDAREAGGEPGENADVNVALAARESLERRIDELQVQLALAEVAPPPADGVAGIGQQVLVLRDGDTEPISYELVGPLESDPASGRLSIASPIGRALVGQRVGATAQVITPRGSRTVTLLAVGEDARSRRLAA
jgi:transcription elongation factor GreA